MSHPKYSSNSIGDKSSLMINSFVSKLIISDDLSHIEFEEYLG